MIRAEQLRWWFLALEKRERWMVGGGGVILLLFIIYVGLISPYVSHRRALMAELQNQNTLLAWMQPAASRIEALRGNQPAALPGGSLLSAVNRSIGSAGLSNALQQAQQASDGSVRVQFSGANFDSLVRWLSELQRTYGITTDDATVTRAAGPGLVDASLKLQSAAQ